MPRDAKYFLVFLAFTCIYFADVFFLDLFPAAHDTLIEFYPLNTVFADSVRQGTIPLWNPYMFIGFPLLAPMQTAVLYPLKYIFLPFGDEAALTLTLVLHSCLAGYFMFLYGRLISGNDFAAVLAGLVFGFMGYITASMKTLPIQNTAIWLPLVFYWVERLRLTLDIRLSFFLACTIALQLYAGHAQIVFQTYLAVSLYLLWHTVALGRGKWWRFLLLCSGGMVLGIIMALPQLVATFELLSRALRTSLTYKMFSVYSYPPHMLVGMLFPFLWERGGTYWGPTADLTEPEGFVGVLTVAVAVAFLVGYFRKRAEARFWGLMVAVFLVLAMGSYLPTVHTLMHRVPLYNLFRGHLKHILQVDFALAVLFCLGMARIMGGDRRLARLAVSILSGIALVGLLGSLSVYLLKNSIDPGTLGIREPEIFSSSWGPLPSSVSVPILFMCTFAGLLLLLSRMHGPPRTALCAFLCVVLVGEVLYFREMQSRRWPTMQEARARQESSLYDLLAARKERVAIVFMSRGVKVQDLLPLTRKIRLLNGYEQLITRDLSDLLDMEGIGFSHSWKTLLENNVILSMLNTRYLVLPKEMTPLVEDVKGRVVPGENGAMAYVPPMGTGLPPSEDIRPLYEPVFEGENGLTLYENRNALPPAYSVRRLHEANSLDEVARRLLTFRSDPRREALVSTEDIEAIGQRHFTQGTVRLIEERPDSVVLAAEFTGRGYVVLADQFYPGWKVRVDGEESALYRTNGILRGVAVPPGVHKITFLYRPLHIYTAMAVSISVFSLCAGALILTKRGRPVR